MILPYRFPLLSQSLHIHFLRQKVARLNSWVKKWKEEEGLEMGMECGLQSIKAKQEGWKRE